MDPRLRACRNPAGTYSKRTTSTATRTHQEFSMEDRASQCDCGMDESNKVIAKVYISSDEVFEYILSNIFIGVLMTFII